MARPAAHAGRLPRRNTRGRRRGARRSRRTARGRRARPAARIWIRRFGALAAVGSLLLAGYLLWLRDSSLVAVRDVRVVGVSSGDGEEVRDALAASARQMTTLHVREEELREAVSAYPSVGSVSADARFPNGLTIEVTERRPVAIVEAEGRDLPVAGDGTLLPGVPTAGLDLPALSPGAEASSGRLTEGPLEQARVLGAAPEPLRPLIERGTEDAEGVGVELVNGIQLRFGDASRAEAKWAAAARILADSQLQGLSYIDLRAPDRPAVGGGAPASGAA
jgi:cell division protein FtsQ